MEKKKKSSLKLSLWLIILLLIPVFLGGCGGKKEVEELAFIIGIGVDVGSEEGSYLVTMQMAKPPVGSESGGGEVENFTVSVEVERLSLLTEKVIEAFNKTPFTGTVRVIILGEELAQQGINEVLDYFQRFYQYRRTIFMLLAKGNAKDIMENKLRSSELPSLSMIDILEGQMEFNTIPVTRLGHYLTILGRVSQCPLIPIVEVIKPGQKEIEYSAEKGYEQLIGDSGIFHEGKLVDTLNDIETKGYLWLNDEVSGRYILIESDKFRVVARVTSSKTKYKVKEMEEGMGITFRIKTQAFLSEVVEKGEGKGIKGIKEWEDFVKEVEILLREAIQKECEEAVEKSKDIEMDFIGIGRKIEMKNPKYWKEIKDTWPEELVDFPVEYDIHIDINQTGLSRSGPGSFNK
ncbi:MAG: Ger(x)C family spore germination protein [Desulfitobacterium sp.]|nr:Ger(x)C family spore germination protein [Desulfitobacterium sp.]